MRQWRSPILRLALGQAGVLMLAFAIMAGASYVTLATLNEQAMKRTVTNEVSDLRNWYSEEGAKGLGEALADRADAASPDTVYLMTRDVRQWRVPDEPSLTPPLLRRAGWHDLTLMLGGQEREVLALVIAFPDGTRLLVGHIAWERERLDRSLRRALVLGLCLALLMATLLGIGMTRAIDTALSGPLRIAGRFADGELDARITPNGSEDSFDRLNHTLNAMFSRIQDLVGGIAHTTDAIAHDLRTPLTRLRTQLEAARAGTSDSTAAAALEDALAETDRLLDTFRAILRLARLEADTNAPDTPLDLTALVLDAVDLLEAVAETRGQRIEVNTHPVSAVGDRDQLFQVLVNLLDNAIKYGPPDSVIQVELTASGDTARLAVSDAGPGIPEADRERVFDRFVRLEAHRGSPGNGLGLALVRAIVRHHGGRIRLLDARPGLRVEVSLPTRHPESAPANS